MNAAGGLLAEARAWARFRVLAIRLLRMRAFLLSLQRPATLSPERWTTASNPEASSRERWRSGSHRISCSLAGGRRTSLTTSIPCNWRWGARVLPMSPEAPLIRTRCMPDDSTCGWPLNCGPCACTRYNQKQGSAANLADRGAGLAVSTAQGYPRRLSK